MAELPNADVLERFVRQEFPQAPAARILEAGPDRVRVERPTDEADLRPGGTVSGPVMMALADHVAYLAVLAAVGLEALAVTTHLSIDFLRKPPAGTALVAEAEIVKLGKSLVVVQVQLQAGPFRVAVASVTYSRPPGRPAGSSGSTL
ncbi:MAG: PaaI family thioesterase [Myxococcota bacterium]